MTPSQAIDRLRQVIRRQQKFLSTEDSYVYWLRRYTAILPFLPPELPAEKKIERFLNSPALRDNLSARATVSPHSLYTWFVEQSTD
jgi:hypothetical protein